MKTPSPNQTPPQQDPGKPQENPGEVKPNIPGIDNPSDKPRPTTDPSNQPVAKSK